MSDSEPERRRAPVNLDVINYQVGALQTSLDRGLASMERAMEKGFDSVAVRLDRIEERQSNIEKQQERSNARIAALEQYRHEQERQDQESAVTQRAALKEALDDSAEAKMTRRLVAIGLGLLGVVGSIIGIIAAAGGFA